jgi:hypothetical protein
MVFYDNYMIHCLKLSYTELHGSINQIICMIFYYKSMIVFCTLNIFSFHTLRLLYKLVLKATWLLCNPMIIKNNQLLAFFLLNFAWCYFLRTLRILSLQYFPRRLNYDTTPKINQSGILSINRNNLWLVINPLNIKTYWTIQWQTRGNFYYTLNCWTICS